jgi:hypothetical protein
VEGSDDAGKRPVNTGTEDWIFGDDPRAMRGFLRSVDEDRRPKIVNNGFGIRTYPQKKSHGLVYIVDSERETCSGDRCRSIEGSCDHVWEDRFRFGIYAGRCFVPPAHRVQIHEKGTGGSYAGVRRYRARPNPMIDGKRFATRMQEARIALPVEYKERLKDVLATVRAASEKKGQKRGKGQPRVDIFDVAFVAVVRIAENLSYEELDAQIAELYNAGYISTKFSWHRVYEAMNKADLELLLARVAAKLMRVFRDVGRELVLDGVVFSTARTDNARKNRYTNDGPIQVTVHAMYEIQWGFLAAFRLTWHLRGRGSGDCPQFPYLATEARKILDYEMILADTAYYSGPNFALARELGFKFVSKPKRDSKRHDGTPRDLLSGEGKDGAPFGMRFDDPLLIQTFPFRNRVEGWHDVLRETTDSYLISRPDRSNYPAQTKEERRMAELMKERPDLAELHLPDDQEERERIINTEQFVGISPNNEFRCRQVYSFLRAIVKAERYYGERVNFRIDRAFQPRAEDAARSIYRGLVDKSSA